MKIVVLAGGTSTERDVSFSSGRQVYKALKENGHEVIMLDVYLGYELTEEDRNCNLSSLFRKNHDWVGQLGNIAEENPDIEAIKALRPDGAKNFFGPNVIALCQEADVVFMALHGENGENGKIQAAFDLMGIRYTGTDYVSSAICMNKSIAKDIMRVHGIPTPAGIHLYIQDYHSGNIEHGMNYPLIVKACSGGSSIGCAIANTADDYESALKEAFKYDDEVVVEEFISGREITCAVMGGKAMPMVEITPKVGFYDYKNKYQAGAAEEICPAPLSDELTHKMQECAEKAFKALRLKSYARFDFILKHDSGEFYCLEANTLPGMTPTSLVPQEAAAIGMNFNELCEKIIELSK